jgi:hypothetical protein
MAACGGKNHVPKAKRLVPQRKKLWTFLKKILTQDSRQISAHRFY